MVLPWLPPSMASSFHRLRPRSAVPIAETRNYVQRVMENLRVYRARFGAGSAMVEPNRHRAATVESRAEPALVEQIPQ